jgi:integrase
MRAVLRWAAGKYKIANPFAGQETELPSAPDHRQAHLNEDQMRLIFSAVQTFEKPVAELLQFLMLTVVRRTEAACARWSEFNRELTTWTLPPERMKGGRKARMHWVPLAPQVSKPLEYLERHEGSDLVFTHTGKAPATGFSRYKKLLDKKLAGAGLPKWRVHDFRRSFFVWAQNHNEDFDFDAGDVADRCLGHETRSKVRRAYDPYEYKRERRILLAAWANFLTGDETPLALPKPSPVESEN